MTNMSILYKQCPDEETLAKFAENPEKMSFCKDFFNHLVHCNECKTKIKFVFTAQEFNNEQLFQANSQDYIRENNYVHNLLLKHKECVERTWEIFKNDVKKILFTSFSSNEAIMDAIAASGGCTRLFFHATNPRSEKDNWKAIMHIPQNVYEKYVLTINMENYKGDDISDGIFVLCGIQTLIKSGQGEISIDDFSSHIDIGGCCFIFPDGRECVGSPVISYSI